MTSRQVGRFLKEADLKPHLSKYWLNPKIDDPAEYKKEVAETCQIYAKASELHAEGTRVVSTDEKTCIQAIERCAVTRPMKPGHPEKIEFEYKRHGVIALIPSFEVATGKILDYHIGPTRESADFAAHIEATVGDDRDGKWIFVLDTHMSEPLVRLAARLSGHDGDLGEKGVSGILKDMASRKRFLHDPAHRVRLVHTPKHCSWLNQVEIWFGVLSRKVLRRGNFTSVEEMKTKMKDFIDYFNRTMARPYKWTYKGIPLTA